MNLRRRHKIKAEVETSSMNDIMFFLMLFFLIASLAINPNVLKVQNPTSDSGQAYSKRTVNISITKDFQVFIDKKPIQIDELDQELKNFKQENNGELSAVLYVDQSVNVQRLVDIMDVCNRNKVKMVLATDKK